MSLNQSIVIIFIKAECPLRTPISSSIRAVLLLTVDWLLYTTSFHAATLVQCKSHAIREPMSLNGSVIGRSIQPQSFIGVLLYLRLVAAAANRCCILDLVHYVTPGT